MEKNLRTTTDSGFMIGSSDFTLDGVVAGGCCSVISSLLSMVALMVVVIGKRMIGMRVRG
jgi:hypothetical protein